MNKIFLGLVLILSLILVGCGGGGDTPTTPDSQLASISGRIVDQSENVIPGVKIRFATYQVTTGPDGTFSLHSIPPDTYTITGIGGTNDHYLIKPITKNLLVGNNDLGNSIIAYKVLGCGVIIQGASGDVENFSVCSQRTIPSLKKIITEDIRHFTTKSRFNSASISAMSATQQVLNDNISFVLLSWGVLTDDEYAQCNDHFKVYYLGPSGTENIKVWDSRDSHPEDPDYNPGAPRAFLDLSNELAELVENAGTYIFRITGYDNLETKSFNLPKITVSLGMKMDKYATNLYYATNNNPPTLNWDVLTGVDGYRIGIYNDAGLEQLVWDSQNSAETDGYLPPSAISIGIPTSLSANTHYYWCVNAYSFDDTGWPEEITRGISGFTR
ncbi:MAG TPA: carboxypeptidase-like regulatory domain-containing protein [Bacillota bacterium]|nr:carboxypeptidase-like regulatory domain-containing protein [Bacillota bacterium]